MAATLYPTSKTDNGFNQMIMVLLRRTKRPITAAVRHVGHSVSSFAEPPNDILQSPTWCSTESHLRNPALGTWIMSTKIV